MQPDLKNRRTASANRAANLGDIEVFARVVQAGSMTAAASQLRLAVAAVSKRIQRLEDKLGVRLIERTTRRLVLTEAGKGFHDRVVHIVEALEDAIGFTSELSTSLRGALRVTAPTSFGRMHLAPHLSRFLEAHPGLDIELELSDDYVDIISRGFHVAVRIGDLPDSSLIARRLAPVHHILCAAPAYLAVFGEPEAPEDLASHRLLAPDQRDSWLLQGPQGGVCVKARGRLRTNSSDVVREAALAGFGIAQLPTWEIGPELAAGRLRVVLPAYSPLSRGGLFAVYASRALMPVKVRTFIDFLTSLYAPKPYWDRGLSDDEALATNGPARSGIAREARCGIPARDEPIAI